MNMTLSAGRAFPLGAHADARGANFALFAANASAVDLCVFSTNEATSFRLTECTDGLWHGYLLNAHPGLRYAYRVIGPAQPLPGDRFNPARLLLDPYARRLNGTFSWDLADDPNTVYGLLGVVTPAISSFNWGEDRLPATPWSETVLYEVHVRGATQRHPDVAEPLRGTYAGLVAPAMMAHYRTLGVTALNILPVAYSLDEERLVRAGQRNYWGYNPINFFAATPRYAVDPLAANDEFKSMVRALHAAGLEVILDVVFNHTAETDHTGPTLSWRGIDNRVYYLLSSSYPARYENHSGCGNTLKLAEPRVLQQVMDALRYWVTECHVDGFRFDLATALARDSGFLAAIRQDPALQGIKLIAEPWDMGPDGYRLGRFPPGWSEWNDRFRDAVRGFWLTHDFGVDALAQRLAGSSEVFTHDARAPQAGINFITAHDGFTLRDLLSYRTKNNYANGEDNRDGNSVSLSTNCGHEGDTNDPAVLERRRRLARALLATLFVAQGVPMLQGGDELGRTQQGNNNAFCQDNALTWFDWAAEASGELSSPAAGASLRDFVAGMIALRRQHPCLRQRRWLTGRPDAEGKTDCQWLRPDGKPMAPGDWHTAGVHGMGMRLTGASGELLCLFNRSDNAQEFFLPTGDWRRVCDSAAAQPFAPVACNGATLLGQLSVHVLERRRGGPG